MGSVVIWQATAAAITATCRCSHRLRRQPPCGPPAARPAALSAAALSSAGLAADLLSRFLAPQASCTPQLQPLQSPLAHCNCHNTLANECDVHLPGMCIVDMPRPCHSRTLRGIHRNLGRR